MAVFQIEYTSKAVENNGTIVGNKCNDGIVMGVEKLITSTMMIVGSKRRIHSEHHNYVMKRIMSSIRIGYGLSVTTFSLDDRVFQIEYAAKVVENNGTVGWIKCKDRIVMGVEKLITSTMMIVGSNSLCVYQNWLQSLCHLFSPDGRVFQIEYAAKAVKNNGTIVGIKCKEGIVMIERDVRE